MLIRVPLSWLREYVDIKIAVDDLAQRLHMSGTEVKGIERREWADIWVGRIAALEKHPNADKLLLATVDYGQGRRKQVVTGATNLAVGSLVPYAALVETKLREPAGDQLQREAPKGLDVRIEDPDACPRFAAVRLENVRIEPSPAWMQQRLIAAGMRPISNVVDITNYA